MSALLGDGTRSKCLPATYLQDGFHAIGSAAGYAKVLHHAFRGLAMTPLEEITHILDTLIHMLPTTGEPRVKWRITPEEIEVL